jgi:hypothetical protein
MLQRWCCPEKPYPSWTSHSLFVEPAQCLSRHWVTDSVFGSGLKDSLDQQLYEAVKEQSGKAGLEYEDGPSY